MFISEIKLNYQNSRLESNLLEQRLMNQRLVDDQGMDTYTLLAHADLYYNLKETNCIDRKIPESVKWQLLHAVQAQKKNGANLLNEEFGFEHLITSDLAFLYLILYSYCCDPRAKDSPIQLHLIQLKAYFIHLKHNYPIKAKELAQELIIVDDSRLSALIANLEDQVSSHSEHFLLHVNSLFGKKGLLEETTQSVDLVQQIIKAAKTSIENGKIHLFSDFSLDRLNGTDLVLLYRILQSYIEPEKTFCNQAHRDAIDLAKTMKTELSKNELNNLPKPIFHKHLFELEKYFANLCFGHQDQKVSIRYAEVLQAINISEDQTAVSSLKQEMRMVVEKKFLPFENHPDLHELFEILEKDRDVNSRNLEKYLKNLDPKECAQLMGLVKINYMKFLKWLKTVAVAGGRIPKKWVSCSHPYNTLLSHIFNQAPSFRFVVRT